MVAYFITTALQVNTEFVPWLHLCLFAPTNLMVLCRPEQKTRPVSRAQFGEGGKAFCGSERCKAVRPIKSPRSLGHFNNSNAQHDLGY